MWITPLGLMACVFIAPGQDSWTVSSSGTQEDLHDVHFADDEHGWALGYGNGLVLRTRDAGRSWQQAARLEPIYYEQIQFLDAERGFICGENGNLLRSDDGGTTWKDVRPPIAGLLTEPEAEDPASSGVRALYYAMNFRSRDEGFVAGSLRDVATRRNENVIFSTLDGGESWERHSAPARDFLFEVVLLADGKTGMAIGNRLHSTRDGGITWSSQAQPIRARQTRGLSLLSAEEAWSCSFDGKVLHTSDGGGSWQIEEITSNRLRSLVFVDEQRGFVVGDANEEPLVMWATTDAGATWEPLDMDPPDLHRLHRAPSSLWAVGKGGVILRLALP